jgi:dethiobiotin synthetase
MKTLLVTGTDTDVGKTYISCLLLKRLRETGMRVGAWKPVCSGAFIDDAGVSRWSDIELLSQAIGGPVPQKLICPQTFQAAVSPNVAAKMEGREVDDELIRNGPVAWEAKADFVLVEGAGGLLSPLSDTMTSADVATQLSCPIIIVAANRLGVINHTLLTVEVAQQRGLEIAAVVLNTMQPENDDASRKSNMQQLRKAMPDQTILNVAFRGKECLNNRGQMFDAGNLVGHPHAS